MIGPKRAIRLALAEVNREISLTASRGGKYAGALAGEGYAGGYADALMDVELLLSGYMPSRRGYWKTVKQAREAAK